MSEIQIVKVDQGAVNARILAKEAKADFRRVEAASLKMPTRFTSAEGKRFFARLFNTLQLNTHFISVIARTRLDHEDVAKHFGLVREVRDLDVGTGRVSLELRDVASRIQPETVSIKSLGGKIDVRSAPTFTADIEFGRISGDLSVTEEVETHKLELTDLRIALDARDGVWHFTHALAGRKLGAMASAATATLR